MSTSFRGRTELSDIFASGRCFFSSCGPLRVRGAPAFLGGSRHAAVELDELLECVAADASFFASSPVLRRLVGVLFEPLPSPDGPGPAETGLPLQTMQVYCAEMLTNPDAEAVFEALLADGDVLRFFFSYWQRDAPDPGVLATFVRLNDFMLQKRFHAFIRAVQMWDVLPRMVLLVHVPAVRILIHSMLVNEALLVSSVPEVAWSPNTLVPHTLARFRAAVDNEANAAEVVVMCEFVTDLLEYHFRSQPAVVSELLVEFDYITSHVLSSHTDFPDEFLTLFFHFLPPKHGAEEWPVELSLSELALASRRNENERILDVVYSDQVLDFVTASDFQLLIAERSGYKSALMRWRVLLVIKQLVETCNERVEEALMKHGNVKRLVDALFEAPHHSMVHALVVDVALFIAELGSDALFHHLFESPGRFFGRGLDAFKLHYSDGTNSPDVGYFGHLVRLFNSLEDMAQSSERVAALLKTNSDWKAFRSGHLEQINLESRYEVVPSPEDYRREGTLVERLQMSQSEEPSSSASMAAEDEDEEDVIVEEEEIIVEEEIVEIVEEVVEYVEEEEEEEYD